MCKKIELKIEVYFLSISWVLKNCAIACRPLLHSSIEPVGFFLNETKRILFKQHKYIQTIDKNRKIALAQSKWPLKMYMKSKKAIVNLNTKATNQQWEGFGFVKYPIAARYVNS